MKANLNVEYANKWLQAVVRMQNVGVPMDLAIARANDIYPLCDICGEDDYTTHHPHNGDVPPPVGSPDDPRCQYCGEQWSNGESHLHGGQPNPGESHIDSGGWVQ
jgi:hypothetical protein